MFDLNPDEAYLLVTLDGPAGAGKSSLAKLLSRYTEATHLDSGATYRAFAVYVLDSGVDPANQEAAIGLLPEFELEVDEVGYILVNGQDMTERIRLPEASRASSQVAIIPQVREHLVNWQREFAKGRDTIAEGRDMGTVVFPEASAKFYITASAEERARRRAAQMRAAGVEADEEAIAAEIRERDARDAGRKMSPMLPAEDAIIIDTTKLTLDEALHKIITRLRTTGVLEESVEIRQDNTPS